MLHFCLLNLEILDGLQLRDWVGRWMGVNQMHGQGIELLGIRCKGVCAHVYGRVIVGVTVDILPTCPYLPWK